MNVLAIIPARGGSKGIKRKNLIDFNGKPLVAHTIEHALGSALVSRVIVSTDDDEIASVSRQYGAEVPFMRPSVLAEDHVLDFPVFEHALNYLHETESWVPEIVVHLRPTAPHRMPTWIDEAVQLLIDTPAADSVRSVSIPDKHPYRMFRIDSDGFLDPIMKHEHSLPYLLRRQDLPPVYYYNCVIDITRSATILQKHSMTGDRILPYVMDPDDVIDIDTRRDLEIARCLFGVAS
jgi:N-acylneuraminate cytidylyltransferase